MNAINKKYERVTVNRDFLRDMEKAQKTAIENEKLYMQARLGYRQTTKEVSEEKKASLA